MYTEETQTSSFNIIYIFSVKWTLKMKNGYADNFMNPPPFSYTSLTLSIFPTRQGDP